MNITKNTNAIDEVGTLIFKGVECWLKAGEIIAKNMDENPDFIEQVSDRYPDISTETLYRFEQIGRKQLCPALLLNDSPGVRRLRKLPFELQSKYATDPIPLLTESGETLSVDVRNLTPEQALQVFSSDHIRSPGEQRAFIEDRKATSKAIPATGGLPYRIVGKTLVVMQSCKFSVRDLAKLLSEIEN